MDEVFFPTNFEYSKKHENAKENSEDNTLLMSPVLILCEMCKWCATYFDETRLIKESNENGMSKCPKCFAINRLSIFPMNFLYAYGP